MFQEWNQTPLHGSTSIREAAETVLNQIHNFYNNFPNQLQTEPSRKEISWKFTDVE